MTRRGPALARFSRPEFWALVGIFAIDAASPFVPLAAAALLAMALVWPRGLVVVARILSAAAGERA